MLLSPHKAAAQILSDELYSHLLAQIEEQLGRGDLEVDQVADALLQETGRLEEYRRLNRENGISSIHLVRLDIGPGDSSQCREWKEALNRHGDDLRATERFSARASTAIYGIWSGFIVVLLIFLTHNIVAIYSNLYDTMAMVVYLMYSTVVIGGAAATALLIRRHNLRHDSFEAKRKAVEEIAGRAVESGCLEQVELYERRVRESGKR